MARFLTVLTLGVTIVAMSGSIAYAALPPTVLWQDNFTGQTTGTAISTLGWSTVPGTNALTSYLIEEALSPPVSVRTYGMNVNAPYGLQQSVTGMNTKTSQWFHIKVHQANGNSATLLDEVRVTTSGGATLYFRIAERQVRACTLTATSGDLGDKLSDNAWHDFDIKYNNAAGSQTISYYINNVPTAVWTTTVSDPGYITAVQFVQQGGAKPAANENHLIGEMAVGTSDPNCAAPAAPTGIAAAPATICSGASSTLSVNNPGAGLTTDWFTVSCGGTAVPSGTGTNSVNVSPTTTTTYYASTRKTADNCVSTTCQSVTVTIPNCDDGNACTTDTCSNGVCSHTNVANGTACEDGNLCTQDDTCLQGNCMPGTPVEPCDTSNGFDADWTLIIRGGTYESEVRKLSKSDPNVACSDLGPFGTVADRTWPYTVATLHDDGGSGQDTSSIKSMCFSNSPVAGAHSPAGARLFGVYEVRNMDYEWDINGNLGPDPGQQNCYSSSAFQIVELNKDGKRIRVMEVGLAANLYDGVHRGVGDVNGPNTDRNILTDPHWGPEEEGWVWTRNNIGGVRIGTIRYNKAKDTICVAAIVREHGSGDPGLPTVGRVYEFALPDWPEEYYPSGHHYSGQPIPKADPSLVKLVQIYEMPCSCYKNGVYEDGVTPAECAARGGTWEGHSVSKNNGGVNEAEHQRPAITFDDNGTMYFTGIFFAATGVSINENGLWSGEPLYHGDVVKCDTRPHWAGKNVYTIPIHGADACNIAISAQVEEALMAEYPQMPPSIYASGTGLAVRGSPNQLLQMPQVTCNDTNAGPFSYLNIFNPAATRTDYVCELQRIESVHTKIAFSGLNWVNSTMTLYCNPGVGAFTDYSYLDNRNTIVFSAGTGVTGLLTTGYTISQKLSDDAIVLTADINGAGGDISNNSIAGEINLSRADIPRSPLWAQYDKVGQRTYLGNEMGACDAHQNFMYILDDNTVVGNVGYFLGNWKESNPNVIEPSCVDKTPFNNPDGSKPGQLNHTWDAAGPPPVPPPNQVGACCKLDESPCEQLSQTACAAIGGAWRGVGTICGEVACPDMGACYKPCGTPCQDVHQATCTGSGGVWAGEGSVCGQGTIPKVCAETDADGDCDGDVDADDFAALQRCLNIGIGSPAGVGPDCTCFNTNDDEFINDIDLDEFIRCSSGPSVPVPAARGCQ